ncbi:sulfite reductase subunit alpha [Rhodococcus sp. JG-3]|uniref:sulfite reductase subunit alpha n=1 Tax=Rhodococcus sp. JG-3 TaxID=1305835 RepID=UPI002351BFAA|nr:sulfite reductase subunit alpha [Rhodococcus sp. JG-3]
MTTATARQVQDIDARTGDLGTTRTASKRSPWNRKNPYRAQVSSNRLLSGPTSAKEVRHFSIDLGDSGITYEAGDGFGVKPVNDAALVSAVIDRLGVPADTAVHTKSGEITLAQALTTEYEIGIPSMDLIEAIAERAGDAELDHVLQNGDRASFDAWTWGRDVVDVLDLDRSGALDPAEFLGLLRPLQHRVYSISSSPTAHEGSVHLTVSTVRYRSAERDRGGVCSTYLADRVGDAQEAGVFLSANKSFRLPSDDTPIIMIGPGTGVAPFRAFLHERRARGASGRNWLFFGDQHRASDFLYEDELTDFERDGLLTRLDLAFSRDQFEKIYVQHRMREAGKQLYGWLEEGTQIYVCGDASRMAQGVDEALHEVVAEHGGRSSDAAEDYVNDLKRAKRYLRDVY